MKKVVFTMAAVAFISLTSAAQSKEGTPKAKKDSINADGTIYVKESRRAKAAKSGPKVGTASENKEDNSQSKKEQEGSEMKKEKSKKTTEIKK